MEVKKKSYKINIKGIVQGVGFRPYVFRLASELGLYGWVLNSSYGLFIEVEGIPENLDKFIYRVINDPPPLALIREYTVEEIAPCAYQNFVIRESQKEDNQNVMISPDIASCSECKQDITNISNRRYQFPFTNCTNCGPRFTIIKDTPYDRVNTTMADFPMCSLCQEEYDDFTNRRFHAQPNACSDCGPKLTLLNQNGEEVNKGVSDLLKEGNILAIKGLGGFHLAVDAKNHDAVARLRQRKKRDAKPFAVMIKDIKTARRYCKIRPEEEALLISPQSPIVVIRTLKDNGLSADLIHPKLNTLGVMLPYTPLHYLLFDDDLDILIMTSANISDEPLISDNQEAMKTLKYIADYFLIHNRDIYNPCDDSVISLTAQGKTQFFRRARGYVPTAIQITKSSPPILAVGSEIKNTFCITRDNEAYLSQHWGDLNHYHNYMNFLSGIERFKNMLKVTPEIIAYDLHPNYQATRWAKAQPYVQLIGVQHHHAHMASVMAENGLEGEVLGLICDGSGWGTDGAVWGCEILKGSYKNFSRLGHLKNLPFLGGDISSKRPYRMAFIYLLSALGEKKAIVAAQRLLPDLMPTERDIILQQMLSKEQILTSSCGRLFDAVAALLGICTINHYEGQAAIEMEACTDRSSKGIYEYSIERDATMIIMNSLPIYSAIVKDIQNNKSVSTIAEKFHSTISDMFFKALFITREKSGLNRVVLSGGVFHNQIILSTLINKLSRQGFEVYQHQKLPTGDGGISLGQAVIASERVI